ncbi:MAG: hypothetical protein FH749_14905 [Firmicutes bacterium]|nr:hypothetical protein [Bacillota bacterium]
MSKQAVVLDLNKKSISLLTDDGAFVSVPAGQLPSARYIGQHVVVPEVRKVSSLRLSLVAAACVLLIFFVHGFQAPMAYASITLDGSSSIELVVDRNLKLLGVTGLNSGGREFLDDYTDLDPDVDMLVAAFTAWSRSQGDQILLVSTTPLSERGGVSEFVAQLVSAWDGIDALLMEITPEARVEAGKHELSASRALVLAAMHDQGHTVSVDSVRDVNPVKAITDAGANADQVWDNLAETVDQAEKVRHVLEYTPKEPGEGSGGRGSAGGGSGKGDSTTGTGDENDSQPSDSEQDNGGKDDKKSDEGRDKQDEKPDKPDEGDESGEDTNKPNPNDNASNDDSKDDEDWQPGGGTPPWAGGSDSGNKDKKDKADESSNDDENWQPGDGQPPWTDGTGNSNNGVGVGKGKGAVSSASEEFIPPGQQKKAAQPKKNR